MHGFIWGVCVVLFGGACVVLFGGHAWFYSRGCAWFYSGGMCGFIWGGMHGFIWGACMFLSRGGVRGFSSFFGYNEIRSMSGRFASYWNAFLLWLIFTGPVAVEGGGGKHGPLGLPDPLLELHCSSLLMTSLVPSFIKITSVISISNLRAVFVFLQTSQNTGQ